MEHDEMIAACKCLEIYILRAAEFRQDRDRLASELRMCVHERGKLATRIEELEKEVEKLEKDAITTYAMATNVTQPPSTEIPF